jgi:hypothetical protein
LPDARSDSETRARTSPCASRILHHAGYKRISRSGHNDARPGSLPQNLRKSQSFYRKSYKTRRVSFPNFKTRHIIPSGPEGRKTTIERKRVGAQARKENLL